jgi:CheY-like chemotaxis protein
MERSLIAVVNSDEAFLEMMQEFLEDEGYEAVTLKQNHRAFEQIKARKPQLVFIELVLTDPESGWMILNKMRLDPQTTTIPVIIASTATDLIARNEEHLRAKR